VGVAHVAVEVEVTVFVQTTFAAPSGATVAILQLIALDLVHRHLLPSLPLLLLLPTLLPTLLLLPFRPILFLRLLLVGVALVVVEAEVMEFAPVAFAAPSGATVATLQLIALDPVHRHLLPTLLLPLLAGAQLLT